MDESEVTQAVIVKKSERGFTLVELLVVVGIIVALAAVIVPSVIQFTGKGDEGAKAAEAESIQAAMDTMMADQSITSVVGLTSTDNSNQLWTSLPAGTGSAVLSTYLRADSTSYYYCYDSTGKITQQDADTAALCP